MSKKRIPEMIIDNCMHCPYMRYEDATDFSASAYVCDNKDITSVGSYFLSEDAIYKDGKYKAVESISIPDWCPLESVNE
jgi:hypothetical protein